MIPGVSTIKVQLSGLRPMMFDRYPGDNSTTLPTAEKMYLTKDRYLTLPALNLFSLLVGENTKSVCRQFWGKNGKTIALGISAYCNIEPFEIPIEDDHGPIQFVGFNEQISVHRAVARLKNGIPNPKDRPCLALPWHIQFSITYQENKYCTLENLRQSVVMGGTLGLGSFRPFFGRYEVAQFEVVKLHVSLPSEAGHGDAWSCGVRQGEVGLGPVGQSEAWLGKFELYLIVRQPEKKIYLFTPQVFSMLCVAEPGLALRCRARLGTALPGSASQCGALQCRAWLS